MALTPLLDIFTQVWTTQIILTTTTTMALYHGDLVWQRRCTMTLYHDDKDDDDKQWKCIIFWNQNNAGECFLINKINLLNLACILTLQSLDVPCGPSLTSNQIIKVGKNHPPSSKLDPPIKISMMWYSIKTSPLFIQTNFKSVLHIQTGHTKT